MSLSERRTLGRLTRSIRRAAAAILRLSRAARRERHRRRRDGQRGAHEKFAEKIEALRKKRGRYEAMLAQLDRIGEDQISLTDPNSRAMAAARTRVAVGYNAQVAVDAKNKLIVEQAVTNQIVDMGLLTQTAEPARDISRGRNDRRRRRPRLLQNRRHRGLREGRLHSSCPQASTRIDGARGFHRVLADDLAHVEKLGQHAVASQRRDMP